MDTSSADLPDTMARIVLRHRPEGLLTWDDVELVEVPLPEPAVGESLLRNEVLAIDASVRSWLSPAKGYLPPVAIGEAVRCSSAGRIVATRCDAYGLDDVVTSLAAWEEYSIVRDDLFTNLPYMQGAFFYKDVAAAVGVDVLDAVIGRFYRAHKNQAASMQDMIDAIKRDTGFDPTPIATARLRARFGPR